MKFLRLLVLLALLPWQSPAQVALSAITATNVVSGSDRVLLANAGTGAARLTTIARLTAAGEIVTPPPGITPPFLVYRQPGPRYTTSIDHEDYNPARTVTRYVLATGDDTATGESWALAKRTVTNAFQSAGASDCAVYVGPGTYAGSNYNVVVNSSLICTGGVATVDRLVWYRCEAYVRGITFNGGVQTLGGPSSSYSNNFIAVECDFSNQPTDNGLQLFSQVGLNYLLRCSAVSNYLDGFSAKTWSSGTTSAWLVEQDCVAQWNGNADADNNSTIHDGFNVARLNGDYRFAYGRNVHDIVATYGTAGQSWNLNCIAGGSRNVTLNYGWSNPDQVEMVLWDCTATDGAAILQFPAWGVAVRPRHLP